MSSVIIVGAGPAGLAAALAAQAHGLQPRVLESREENAQQAGSRALFVHRESLQLLDSVSPGVGTALCENGIQWDTRETWRAGKLVYSRAEDRTSRNGLPPYVSLRQSDTVALLMEACVRQGIDVQSNSTIATLGYTTSGVRVETDREHLCSDFVIGADGARSVVRRSIGARLEGRRLPGHHVVVDILGPTRAARTLEYACVRLDGRNVLIIPFAGGYQIDVQCRDEADSKVLSESLDWVAQLVGHGDADRVAWVSAYRFTCAVASTFVDTQQRILLVGEAAHLFPPFGARGMNSSFADAGAAAAALGLAHRAGGNGAITAYGIARRDAARINADAAHRAFAHLHPSRRMRCIQSAAARVSGVVTGAGEWLETSAYGPRVRTGGRY